MSERNPAEAVETYRQLLQRLLSCVTDRIMTVSSVDRSSPYLPGDYPHLLALGEGRPTPLTGAGPLVLRVAYRYEIIEVDGQRRLWEVHTRGYMLALSMRGQMSQEEIVAYHWHPAGGGSITIPHLHVGSAIAGTSLQIGERYAHRLHFPTGSVPLSLVIRMAIEEFGVHPLRDDWREVLTQEQAS